MLIVKRITSETLHLIRPLTDKCLVSEEARLRINALGFQLSYMPLPRTEWRSFPPVDYADPIIITQDEGSAFYGAFKAEQYAGGAAVTLHPTGWAEILDLRVDAELRRQGIGRELLEKCERFAEKRGLYGLRITCTDTNPQLCQFLEHMGFTLQGVDRMALAMTPQERGKPISRRACQLTFYRKIQKG